MSGDPKKHAADNDRIDVSQDYECRYRSEKFGVRTDELRRATENVGPMANDAARELGK